MNFPRPSSLLAITLLVCACAAMAQGGDVNWKGTEAVQKYLRDHPVARRMTQGPIGSIIDFIIDIIIILLDLIFGGNFGDLIGQSMGGLLGQLGN